MYSTINGTVLFVDILGFGALTKEEFVVSPDTIDGFYSLYHVNGLNSESVSPNQLIAAWTLSTFRESLNFLSLAYPGIHIAQLSDCAFIWSEDHAQVLKATHLLMWRLTASGILARGGLASGSIVVHKDASPQLGKFILGDAVTRAVALEGKGKGCRIFTDPQTVTNLYENFPGKTKSAVQSAKVYNEVFKPLVNPLDYSAVDEFRWYLYINFEKLERKKFILNPNTEALAMGALISLLRGSPNFSWNCQTKAGAIHIASSMDFISKAVEVHGVKPENVGYTAETLMQIISSLPRSEQIIKSLFAAFSVDALPKNITKKLFDQAQKSLNKSLEKITRKTEAISLG